MIHLLPFQEIGRDFLVLRPNAILADDMGLGKTYMVIEAFKKAGISQGVVICPQSIRRSWVKRIREQMPNAFIKEITSPKLFPDPAAFNVVNYDIVWKEPLISQLNVLDWQVMVCDELHFLKNVEAKRTKFLLGKHGLHKRCEHRWMVGGTPVLNRPIELYPVLRSLFPQFLGKYAGYYDFAYRFCAGCQGPFGFDANGASNLPELAALLSPLMLRRMKSDVLTELPAVTYDKVYLDPSDKLIRLTEQENAEVRIGERIGDVSSIRRALGMVKAQAAVNHLKEIVETRNKILVFMWHKDVVSMIADAFPGECVRHTGDESAADKERSIRRFITDPDIHFFLGNISSTGFGVDGLQAVCDTAVFVEMSYVPKEIEQCIDRLNRMGQKNPVQIQFLIAEGSIDEQVINTLAGKARTINTIMGERRVEAEFVATKCGLCQQVVEMSKLKRAAGMSVCQECRKKMECLI